MHLSKIIPQHVSRQDFTWIKRDFTVMDHDYRAIRVKVGGGMDRCDWCEYAFINGDMMALAGRPKGRNWMLCQTCAQMAEGSAQEAELARDAWLIRKRGYYYRPNRAGYTASVAEAGRYTEAEAKTEAEIEPAIMQAIPLSQALSEAGSPETKPVQSQMPQHVRDAIGPSVQADDWDDSQDLMDRDRG